jgi:antitoxin component YwqK of YwqJK toxin-antitoxin module
LDGPLTARHLNGRLRASGTFQGGIKVGRWREWDEDGNPIKDEIC